MGLRYKISYRQDTANSTADALFGRLHTSNQAMAMSVCQPTWVEDIRASYAENDQAKKQLTEFPKRPDAK